MKKLFIPVILTLILLMGCNMNTRKDSSPNTPTDSSMNTQNSSSVNNQDNTSMNNAYQQLDMDKVGEWLKNETDYILLDVRSAEEYVAGHMSNAINIPIDRITDQEIAELPNKDQKILVYSHGSNYSQQAAERLANLGYTNVFEIGDINNWTGGLVRETE